MDADNIDFEKLVEFMRGECRRDNEWRDRLFADKIVPFTWLHQVVARFLNDEKYDKDGNIKGNQIAVFRVLQQLKIITHNNGEWRLSLRD